MDFSHWISVANSCFLSTFGLLTMMFKTYHFHIERDFHRKFVLVIPTLDTPISLFCGGLAKQYHQMNQYAPKTRFSRFLSSKQLIPREIGSDTASSGTMRPSFRYSVCLSIHSRIYFVVSRPPTASERSVLLISPSFKNLLELASLLNKTVYNEIFLSVPNGQN